MTDFEFYQLTKETLEGAARKRGITPSELRKYYSHTDAHCNFYQSLTGIPQVFAQMAFHMQNATMISSIVKFETNFNFLKNITCDFVPADFLAKYPDKQQIRVDALVDDLRWNDETNTGLKWNSSKSTKKDAIVTRFAKSLFECAKYLNNFNTKQDVLNDLMSHNSDVKSLIKYFNSKVKTGFSIALSCDFLKELDNRFDLPKPDVHIKDVISALKQREENYYNTSAKEYQLIEEMQEITENINNELVSRGENPITVYQLDRMIWLTCTENFFIDFPQLNI